MLVLALTTVAEKGSPKLSGLLSGLPLGSAITLIFFAIEIDTAYVQRVALYNIHGLFASLAFCIGYYISTFYKGKGEIIMSILISFLFYILIAYVISFIRPHIIITPLLVLTLMIMASMYFAQKEDFKMQKVDKFSYKDLLIRIVLTVVVFMVISSLPKWAPENIAGIFSSFPTVLLPVLLIIHFNHSNLQARTIIKNTPFGLGSIVFYSVVVYFTYDEIGILYGTILAFIASFCFIWIQTKIFKALKIGAKRI